MIKEEKQKMQEILKILADIRVLAMRMETIGGICFDEIELNNEKDKIYQCKNILSEILSKWKTAGR